MIEDWNQRKQAWRRAVAIDERWIKRQESALHHLKTGNLTRGVELLLAKDAMLVPAVATLEQRTFSWDFELRTERLEKLAFTLLRAAKGLPDHWLLNTGVMDHVIMRADQPRLDKDVVEQVHNRMLRLPAGQYWRGALSDDDDALGHERPRHSLTLSRDVWLGRFPVTQALFEQVLGFNPSHFIGPTRPVECINWLDAVVFCNRLSHSQGLTPAYSLPAGAENRLYRAATWYDTEFDKLTDKVGCCFEADGYRLMTEAEWEIAAVFGRTESDLLGLKWLENESWVGEVDGETLPVGLKAASPLGCYDVFGNVWEWVWDAYSAIAYQPSQLADAVDPVGPVREAQHTYYYHHKRINNVLRGGSWHTPAKKLRFSHRGVVDAAYRNPRYGFRICRSH